MVLMVRTIVGMSFLSHRTNSQSSMLADSSAM
jgi:hypothetical protein